MRTIRVNVPQNPSFLDTACTYADDHQLFEELGLPLFELGTHTEAYLGRVHLPEGFVDITVGVCPAQFWTFRIFRNEDFKLIKVETGSGCLRDYWDCVVAVLKGNEASAKQKTQMRRLKRENMFVTTSGGDASDFIVEEILEGGLQ